MITNTHTRLILKLETMRHYLPYGVQSMADECIAIIKCMDDKANPVTTSKREPCNVD